MLRFLVAVGAVLCANVPGNAQKQLSREEMLAGLLVRNGLLCSRVIETRKGNGPNEIEATCIKYYAGTDRVRYIVDLSTGKVSEAK